MVFLSDFFCLETTAICVSIKRVPHCNTVPTDRVNNEKTLTIDKEAFPCPVSPRQTKILNNVEKYHDAILEVFLFMKMPHADWANPIMTSKFKRNS